MAHVLTVTGRSRPHRWRLAPLAVMALTLAACAGDPAEPESADDDRALAGTWSRINSSFQEIDGMRVQVEAAETEGVITTTPANVYQFQTGDLKWRNIVRLERGTYDFEDLVREANTGTPSYVTGRIRVNAGGDSLSISFPTTGTFQEWIRVN
jgi:hypothetical protein